MLSTILFLVSFFLLSLWFLLYKDHEKISATIGKLFLLATAVFFLLGIFLPNFASWTSLAVHGGLLFFGGFFLNTFNNNKIVFVSLMGLMMGGYFYNQTGLNPWPFGESQENITAALPVDIDPESELLVELSNGHQIEELQNIVQKYDLEIQRAFFPKDTETTDLDDYYTINIPKEKIADYAQIVAELQQTNLLDHIEANELLRLDPSELQKIANPPSQRKYTMNDADLHKVWAYEAMNMQDLHQYLISNKITAAKKAKIAIIDTGVDGEHEDLKANFVSTASQHDKDPQGHGTHCAGIAAAVSNNGLGIASFSPNNQLVEVTSIKVFGKYGNTSQKKIIDGMIEAVDNGADILSMSLGGPSTDRNQRAYRQAVIYANNKGAIVVVAAGNENIDARRRSPASVEGVITVAAIDSNFRKAKFSNTVDKLKMGIAAPGVQIYSTVPNDQYDYYSGTSMATPYVAGLLGIMKALKPNLTTQQAYAILNQTGTISPSQTKTGAVVNPIKVVKEVLK